MYTELYALLHLDSTHLFINLLLFHLLSNSKSFINMPKMEYCTGPENTFENHAPTSMESVFF